MIVYSKFLIVTLCLVCATPVLAEERAGEFKVARYNEESQYPNKPEPKPELLLQVDEKYEYYDIDGSSLEELRKKMRSNGTKWNDGKTYAALCTWDIKYRYDVRKQDGLHSIKSATTDVSIVYRFPKWTPPATAPEPVVNSWKRYIDKVHEHEFGHRDLAVKSAEEINEALAAIGSFTSERELNREAKKAVQATLKKLKEVQIAYDDHTRHGETQGAVLH